MCAQGSAPSPVSPGLHEILVAAGAVAITVAGALAMAGGGMALATSSSLGLRAQIAVGSGLLVSPALLAILLFLRSSWRHTLALGPLPPRALALSALLGGALWLGSIGLMELQAVFWPPSPEYLEAFRRIHRALAPTGPLDAVVSVVVIALLPALSEELVVRGILLPALKKPFGPTVAVVGSALVFALLHDPYRHLFTLAVGLVLGALRLRTGSLWPPIVAHATLNTLTFLVAPLVDDPSQATYEPQPLLGLAFLLAGAAGALPLLKAFRRSVDGSVGPT